MLIGAHVSSAGGVRNAPARGAAIGATAIQIFTKVPSRWAERSIDPDEALAFRRELRASGIQYTAAHDSYLINLATADPILRDRSYASFRAELERSRDLGLDAVVTHPGNATDGDVPGALTRNAALIERAIEETGPGPLILLETTAGSGRVLGSTFAELAAIRDAISSSSRERVGICFDTCHVFAAGYDLVEAFDEVIEEFDRVLGLAQLRLFHLNDSLRPRASRVDRHADIGEGELGDEPFRRIMTDPRFDTVPKILETPKGKDPVAADRRNIARLLRMSG